MAHPDEYKKTILEQYGTEQAVKQKEVPERTAIKQSEETIEFLFAEEIRTRWIQSLRETKKIATIITPWVNENVIDHEMLEDFRKLAQKKILINIGWGIAPTVEREEKPIKNFLLSELNQIKTPDNLPAINVFHIGNMHNKDFVADRRIHISGSHNYLSYRGDRHPRAESAYYVINQVVVQKALKKFDDLFETAIKRTWDRSVKEGNQDGFVRCCVAWSCIYRPKVALMQIRNLTLDNKYSNNQLLIEGMFKSVMKVLVQLPKDEESKGLINQVVDYLEKYDIPAASNARTSNSYVQEWVNFLCENSETKQIISDQKRFLRRFALVIANKP